LSKPGSATRTTRRRTTIALLTGALTLALSAAAPLPTAVAQPAPEEHCDPAASAPAAARVGWGREKGLVQDPNSVTASEAAAIDARLSRDIDRMIDRGRLRANGRLGRGGQIVIDTHIHVITAEDGTGAVEESQIEQQMEAINDGYAGRTAPRAAWSPFRFEIASIDVTANDAWYDWGFTETFEEDAETVAAKRALRRGGQDDLNIYIADLQFGLLGYATFPGEGDPTLDGVVLLNGSLPGGYAAPYNEGDTATHEIGHWLGLFHTFENGCTFPGDYVPDTPYQAMSDAVFYCGDNPEFGDDTCADLPGKDPVHNFMSYGTDECLDHFTPLQTVRQVAMWLRERARG
jgi:hypothetical protein